MKIQFLHSLIAPGFRVRLFGERFTLSMRHNAFFFDLYSATIAGSAVGFKSFLYVIIGHSLISLEQVPIRMGS